MTMWTTVEPSAELCERYRAHGWWDDQTLPTLLDEALARSGSTTFRVHSRTRPWSGTVAEVTTLGRRLATGLANRGIAVGDPVAFTLPNSAEAAVRVLRPCPARCDAGSSRAHRRTARPGPRVAGVRREGTGRMEPARSAL